MTQPVTRWAALVVAVGLLAAGGCGEPGAGEPVAASDRPATAGQPLTSVPAGAEQLAPCPPSDLAGPVDGGLPDVVLPCLGRGPDVRMAGLGGEPLLVNVWASWCGPCRSEMPMLQRLYTDGVQVLGVDAEDRPEAGGALLSGLGVRYPSVYDPQNAFAKELGITSKPITLFVAADGRVVHTQIGPFASADQLRDLVSQHLRLPAP